RFRFLSLITSLLVNRLPPTKQRACRFRCDAIAASFATCIGTFHERDEVALGRLRTTVYQEGTTPWHYDRLHPVTRALPAISCPRSTPIWFDSLRTAINERSTSSTTPCFRSCGRFHYSTSACRWKRPRA